MIKYYLEGMKTRFSFLKQLLTGLARVILPLTTIIILAIFFKKHNEYLVANIDNFITTMFVITISETIAVIVNPLPKWAFDNNIEGIGDIADKILKKKEGGE